MEQSRTKNPFKRSQPRQYHNRSSVFITLLLAVTFHLSNAFIPFFGHRLPTASAMSTDNSITNSKGLHPPSSLSAEVATDNSEESLEKNTSGDEESGTPLLLPACDNDDPSIPKIRLGDTIAFEEMGPVIINPDCTTRRIDNWDQMTKQEQEVAWRRISKRNAERRAALLEKQQKMEQEES
ncbi:hypothetical protein HJC23_012396 [Cyclotella cryptica]|uniref:Uncharacterized protein n=1 Tax=Cyclotella cryptica TaxID=29204 RepID=A0ABD3Q429_9STRA|eukprot:CCRYP_009324-RA/>CCRYP_009324-RA protein AED:0.00 eAED:0.00 QI:49/-1/1/1/-1/1/1/369/180